MAFTVVAPVATLVASPCALTVATVPAEDDHNTDCVMSCWLESEKVPVAANCFVVPTAMLGFAGVTAMDTRVAAETTSEAVPLTEPDVAVIVAVPPPTPLARPDGLIVAIDDDDVVHETEVNNCVLPSSKLPTAPNCKVVPAAMVGTAGVTAIEVRCAATTVSVEVSLKDPKVAVIVVDPAATVVTIPLLSTVAVAVEEEFQVTPLDRSELVPLLYVAVATYC